jgi:RNA polymerase sigma-70 factor (ECF subfamily)
VEPYKYGSADVRTDEEIVAQTLAGDTNAFEVVVRRHGKRLFAVAVSVLRDEAEAEDVVQDTYVSAFEHLHQFAGRARFSTWLARIALYKALAKLSSRNRTQSLEYEDSDGEVQEYAVPDTAPNPEQRVAHRQHATLLHTAIMSLPENYRHVMILREMRGDDTLTTARKLNITPANVKVRLHRAHAMLKREYEQVLIPPIDQAQAPAHAW